MTRLRFDGRVALVTGAGGGLGRAYAVYLASLGARVVVNDLLPTSVEASRTAAPGGPGRAQAEAVVREIVAAGGEAVVAYGSVAKPEDAASIVQKAIDTYGRLDILINNAGICDWLPFGEITYGHFQKMRQIHYDGPWLVTQAAWPHMQRQNYGRILFITSHVGLAGMANASHYGSAKWASAGLARMLSFEGGSADIKSNALGVLGYTQDFVDNFFATENEEERELEVSAEPWWIRNIRGDQVAPVAAWMVHEQCPMNGEMLDTGGGHTMKYIFRTTNGFIKRDLTIDDVATNIDKITDDSKTNVWSGVEEALHNRLGRLVADGADPMDTKYPAE